MPTATNRHPLPGAELLPAATGARPVVRLDLRWRTASLGRCP